MNKYGVGDLVWVPAGTKTFSSQFFVGNINNKVHHVNQKHIRKIDSKELIYDKISRSSANV